MNRRWVWLALSVLLVPAAMPRATGQGRQAQNAPAGRNVIIFVADGLRHDSVNERDTPAFWRVRTQGVHFSNSYALFPTFTTPNASAIATGHGLGDTGVFGNTLWVGYPAFDTGNFGESVGTPVPFTENDHVLADLDDHFDGNYLGHDSLLAVARARGYNTATVGKAGPVAIQDVTAIAPTGGKYPSPSSAIVVDDATGTPAGLGLPARLSERLARLNLAVEAPARTNGYGATSRYSNGFSGDRSTPGTRAANVVQQQWFADVTTRAILPLFSEEPAKPFAVMFWSRDPDGTQHNQGDSLGTLVPGINGDSSKLGIQNADRTLRQLLDWLDANPAIKANTNVVITSDHGFATISRREIDRAGRTTASEAARHDYVNQNNRVDTGKGTLPPGFLAIDLALGLRTSLFDPGRSAGPNSPLPYARVRLESDRWEHPLRGDGLLGAEVRRPDAADATAIVAANGGSDLIYVPDANAGTVTRVVNLLTTYDYIGGIFVDDKFGPLPGTLPLSAIGLVGSTRLPRPAIVVAFKVFYLDPADIRTAVQIADVTLQQGQGNHGGFGRDSTFNNMAAFGPDFRTAFDDSAPMSNADIVPTLAHVLGFEWAKGGWLRGRVAVEALKSGTQTAAPRVSLLASPSAGGLRTVLHAQELDGVRYFQHACFLPEPMTACR
jgi:hypothetical protein